MPNLVWAPASTAVSTSAASRATRRMDTVRSCEPTGREPTPHRVTHDPPAVADRTQPVRGAQPGTGSQPVEQVQRVREELVGGHGVARELSPVHEQHTSAGAGQQRGDGGPGAAGADDDDVVLLVLW